MVEKKNKSVFGTLLALGAGLIVGAAVTYAATKGSTKSTDTEAHDK